MKTKTIILIIAVGLLVLGVFLSLGAMIATGFDFEVLNDSEHYEQREYIAEASSFKKIIIDDSNKEINVVSSEDDKIHITYYDNEKEHYEISEQGDTLVFNYNSKRLWYEFVGFHIYIEDYAITIHIPEAYAGNIDLITSNNPIKMQNVIMTGELLADTSNSGITMENVKGKAFNLTTSNGTVDVNNILFESRFNVKSSNGKIKASYIQGGDLDLDTSNARIELDGIDTDSLICDTSNAGISGTIIGAIEDFTITSHTSNGDNNLSEEYTGHGSRTLYIDTSNGDIDIEFIDAQ
jgi:DUF4097 and DUF4098 domain-containing protein YvlB